MIDLNIRRTTLCWLLAAAALGGCRRENNSRTELPGVLGYAQFSLRCEVEPCVEGGELPKFAIGSTFDFDIEHRKDFPFHEAGASLEFHVGGPVLGEASEVQTVLAVSNHSDGYLIDYAHIYLYTADHFLLERTDGQAFEREGDTYVLRLGETVGARLEPQHRGTPLAGTVRFEYAPTDRSVVDASGSVGGSVTLRPTATGEGALEVRGVGHTQVFECKVTAGPRTSPTPSNPDTDPDPRRVDPTPDEPRRRNPGGDEETGSTGGESDTDTDDMTGGAA